MGVLYETYRSINTKKRCTVCGCIMDADHVGDVCEVCLDELKESDSEEVISWD